MEMCRTDALVYNLVLSLSAEEVAAGNEGQSSYERYSAQVSAVKKIAEQQKAADFAATEAERRKGKGKEKAGALTDDPMESEKDADRENEGDGDAEGEEEEGKPAAVQVLKKSKRLRHEKKSAPAVPLGGVPAKVSLVPWSGASCG